MRNIIAGVVGKETQAQAFQLSWFDIATLIIVPLAAFGLRLWVASHFRELPRADALDYQRLAISVLHGKGFVDQSGRPSAFRPPGYPIFLAANYAIFGASLKVALVAQAVLGGIDVVLIIFTGWLLLGKKEGILAGLICAAYPGFVWVSRLLLSENLAICLTIAVILSAAKMLQTKSMSWAVVVGIALGFSILVRGSNVFLAGVLLATVAVLGFRKNVFRAGLRLVGTVFVVCLLVLLPWTLRNYVCFKRFVPASTEVGLELYCSYWPPVRGSKRIWGTKSREDPVLSAANAQGDEAASDQYLRWVTLTRLSRDPGLFFRLVPEKFKYLLAPFDWEIFPHAAGTSRTLNLGYVLLLLPAGLGLVVLIKKGEEPWWLVTIPMLALVIQTLLFHGTPRYRLVAEPALVLLASSGIIWASSRVLRARRHEDSPKGVRERVSIRSNP